MRLKVLPQAMRQIGCNRFTKSLNFNVTFETKEIEFLHFEDTVQPFPVK